MRRFVRSLEERVRELEQQQAFLISQDSLQPGTEGATQLGLSTILNLSENANEGPVEDSDLIFSDQDTSDHGNHVVTYTGQSPTIVTNHASAPRAQETLEQNLRDVSLAAVAEPYLGTMSGLTFAKLTQAVLRRLSPDGRDFVFSPRVDGNMVPLEGATNLHLELMNSVYFDFDQAIDFSLLAGETSLPLIDVSTQIETTQLPHRAEVLHLARFYFDHSHTLYPIVHQQEVMADIHSILLDPEHHLTLSPPCMFRIWMVLAIGSTTYSSITLAEEFVSRLYYEKAMTYFDASMDYGDVVSPACDLKPTAMYILIRVRLRSRLSCYRCRSPSSTN